MDKINYKLLRTKTRESDEKKLLWIKNNLFILQRKNNGKKILGKVNRVFNFLLKVLVNVYICHKIVHFEDTATILRYLDVLFLL